MNIDLTFVTNDWLRAALTEAVVSKANALVSWSRQKELDLHSDIQAIIEGGTSPSEVIDTKLEQLCNRYERQQQTTAEFVGVAKQLAATLNIKQPAKSTGDAMARAKALLKK